MLPSNFQLKKGDKYEQLSRMNKTLVDLPKTQCATGPADYNIERIIGTNMAVS